MMKNTIHKTHTFIIIIIIISIYTNVHTLNMNKISSKYDINNG